MYNRALEKRKSDGTRMSPLEALQAITVFVPKYCDYDEATAAIARVQEEAVGCTMATASRTVVTPAVDESKAGGLVPPDGKTVFLNVARLQVRVRRRKPGSKTATIVVADNTVAAGETDPNYEHVVASAGRTYRSETVSVGQRMVLRKTVRCKNVPDESLLNGEIVIIRQILRLRPDPEWCPYNEVQGTGFDIGLVVEAEDGIRRANVYRTHDRHADVKRIGSQLYEFSGFSVQHAQVCSVSLALGSRAMRVIRFKLAYKPVPILDACVYVVSFVSRGRYFARVTHRIDVPVRRVSNKSQLGNDVQGGTTVRCVFEDRCLARDAFRPPCVRAC